MSLVELYKGQTSYTVQIGNLTRELPLRQVEEGMWIASNHVVILNDVEFINKAAEELANRIREYKPERLLTAECKSVALAYKTAEILGLDKIAVARKSPKAYMDSYIEEKVKSITTEESQKLVLDRENIELIRGRKICLLDDVVSTGRTITALENLAYKAGARVVCKAAIFLEGPWYKEKNIIYISTLPIFVTEELYNSYLQSQRIEI